jgi:hypothetical protein
LTFSEFKSDSEDYVQADEETVSHFSSELLPVQDPLSHEQSATAVTPPTEEVNTLNCILLI